MINRYECITEWPWYRPCVTDDGPWVTYDDHAKEIATLRAENNRLADESHNARQAANGENALRLEAERGRDTLRAAVERWVKEVARLKLSAEKAERESARSHGKR